MKNATHKKHSVKKHNGKKVSAKDTEVTIQDLALPVSITIDNIDDVLAQARCLDFMASKPIIIDASHTENITTTNDVNAFSVLCTCELCKKAGYVIVGKSRCLPSANHQFDGAYSWLPQWTFPITQQEAYTRLREIHSVRNV